MFAVPDNAQVILNFSFSLVSVRKRNTLKWV